MKLKLISSLFLLPIIFSRYLSVAVPNSAWDLMKFRTWDMTLIKTFCRRIQTHSLNQSGAPNNKLSPPLQWPQLTLSKSVLRDPRKSVSGTWVSLKGIAMLSDQEKCTLLLLDGWGHWSERHWTLSGTQITAPPQLGVSSEQFKWIRDPETEKTVSFPPGYARACFLPLHSLEHFHKHPWLVWREASGGQFN